MSFWTWVAIIIALVSGVIAANAERKITQYAFIIVIFLIVIVFLLSKFTNFGL